MKKLITIILVLLMASNSYAAISWTKSWSAADDGSPFGGADIQNIQNDASTQVPTLTGNNTMSGDNTFSGTTTFSGTVTGVGVGGKDAITRGFELVWASTTTVTVNPGTLYHGTTQVNRTTTDTMDVTDATDYVTGVSQQGTSKWLYVYVDSTGTIKMDSTAPDKADTSGNTTGTKYYYYYVVGATYYRCIGAIRLNATGAGEVTPFFQTGNLITYDVPINITTTISAGAWKGATSCAVAIPSISLSGLFGLYANSNGVGISATGIWIRPFGATWSTGQENGVYHDSGGATSGITGSQRICMTDSLQQIDYYNHADIDNTSIDVEGYYLNIR